MSKIITDALLKLDAANDNHWTSDGLPRIETLKFLTGNQSLTRNDIFAACPTFCRGNPTLTVGDVATPEVIKVDQATAPVVAEANAIVNTVVVGSNDTIDAAIAALAPHIDEARKAVAEATAVFNELNAKMDLLVIEKERNTTPHVDNVHNYQQYLKVQQEVREMRAQALRDLKATGIEQAMKTLRSPIDEAMKNRRR